MDELPHDGNRPRPALGKFGDQAAQRGVPLDPLRQPDAVVAGDRLRPVTTYLVRRSLQVSRSRRTHKMAVLMATPELPGRLIAGQPASRTPPQPPASEDLPSWASPSGLLPSQHGESENAVIWES